MIAARFAWLGLLSSVVVAQGAEPDVCFVQLPAQSTLIASIRADLDGDERTDLLLAWTPEDTGERLVQWHFQTAATPAYRSQPERPALRLDGAVLAVAMGDVLVEPGPELIVFTARVVWAVRLDTAGEPHYERLVDTRFLWQGVEPGELFGWQQGVRDIDGDGLVDLLLPEPDGYRVAVQRRSEDRVDFETHELELPIVPPEKANLQQAGGGFRFRDDGDGSRFDLAFSTDERDRGPLLRVVDRVAAPKLDDWDADGDLDVFCLHAGRLLVWLQNGDSGFARAPDIDAKLPRDRRLVDPAWRVMARDLDNDQRVDLILHSSRMVDDQVRVSLEYYRNPGGDPFAGKSRADDRIRLKGLVGFGRYEDIDGDDLPECIIGTMDPGLLDAMSGGGALRGVLNVFRNGFGGEGFDGERPRFVRPVAMAHDVEIPTESSNEREGGNFESAFFGDVTGDGVRDWLQRLEAGTVRIYRVARRGAGFDVGEVVYQLGVAADAQVRAGESGRHPEFFVLEATQVIHVRFR